MVATQGDSMRRQLCPQVKQNRNYTIFSQRWGGLAIAVPCEALSGFQAAERRWRQTSVPMTIRCAKLNTIPAAKATA
jgi:hypothetical protein